MSADYASRSSSPTGIFGTPVLAIKETAATDLSGATDGNFAPLQVDANGNLRVIVAPASAGTTVTSGANVAAAANNQTLASAVGKTLYLCGFDVTGLGATAAGSINITTTGLTNNLNYVLPIPAGVTVGVTPLNKLFIPPIPASAPNTNIVLNVPSFGAGNTTASANAYAFLI